MATPSPFFDLFPKIPFDINQNQLPQYDTATNIFHRMGYIRQVLSNASAYYLYEVQDGETPDILAERVYGDPGANWMIIYANNILDPQWEWPLDDNTLKDYITEKYGSLTNAVATIHHYEKVVESTAGNNDTYTRVYKINGFRLTENNLNVPYEYYTPYKIPFPITSADTTLITADSTLYTVDDDYTEKVRDTSLPTVGSPIVYSVNDTGVKVNTYSRAVTCYDYETQLNDQRRVIKIVKSVYYTQIMSEYKSLVRSLPTYVRTFV
jgi:hypothetical protein